MSGHSRIALLAAIALASNSPAAEAVDGCHWQALARAEHTNMIRTPPQAVREAADGAVDSDDAYVLRQLLTRPALALGEVSGQWQVRSLQFTRMFGDGGQVFAYPFFKALIDRNPCGYHLAKVSGSQRRSGQLYPSDDPHQLAFLGASTINAQPPGDYDPRRPADTQSPGDANSAGYLYRIGPDELLMVLDASDDAFEVYHLKR